MAYTEEQREFYRRAKSAGWSDEKIRMGIRRLGERAAAPAPVPGTPSEPPSGPLGASGGVPGTTPPAPSGVAPAPAGASQDDGTAWMQNYNPAEGMNALERFGVGYGGAIPGLVAGAKQIFAGEEDKQRLMDEEAKRREAMSKLGLAGTAGNVLGNVAAAAPLAMAAAPIASMGLPAAVGVGAAEGAGLGALAPVAEEGERARNAMIGGALGGAIPIGGAAARKAGGKVDPVMKKAAEVLKRSGVTVSRGDISPGPISSFGQFIMDRTPIIGAVNRRSMQKDQQKVADSLFRMLDRPAAPTNKADLRKVSKDIGEELNKTVSNVADIDFYGVDASVQKILDDYAQLLPSQQSGVVSRHAGDILDMANSGGKVSGSAYQKIRSDLGASAASASPAESQALFGLQKILDDVVDSKVGPDEAAKIAKLREQFRLANILKKVKVKDGRFDIKGAASRVENAANSGRVMPEAEELLSAAQMGIRNIPPPNMLNAGGAVLGHLFASPLTVGSMGVRGLSNLGAPQALAGSKSFNTLMSRLLRGYGQTELSDED